LKRKPNFNTGRLEEKKGGCKHQTPKGKEHLKEKSTQLRKTIEGRRMFLGGKKNQQLGGRQTRFARRESGVT